jgi:hypothetical protein
MKLVTITTIQEYNDFEFKEGQSFKIGVLEYSIINKNGQLWTKDQDGYGGELKLKNTSDSFKWAIECKVPLIQIK